ncbi:hypothetical protein J8273_5381 [Carpediemonas membranifera]|uniref:Uncharacterized protein n=1 Tax=Carpediemonas membranifera TaxID=201153 RepID=A0A8J6BWF2_9EUKA|nr:hypothetical protein J8273_5381 [Carpediemonas membranifera]|eukprot:KAG9392391.1 hypothetical protein J8273_5381 [Carpediemonas membranifera]
MGSNEFEALEALISRLDVGDSMLAKTKVISATVIQGGEALLELKDNVAEACNNFATEMTTGDAEIVQALDDGEDALYEAEERRDDVNNESQQRTTELVTMFNMYQNEKTTIESLAERCDALASEIKSLKQQNTIIEQISDMYELYESGKD